MDGHLWFVGRSKDVIVRGGNKIAPLEVEAALSEHPAVLKICVIGIPDPVSGEVPHGYVILRPGAEASPQELRAIAAALIERVLFFKNAGSGFPRDIIPRLDARVFAPGDVEVYALGRAGVLQLAHAHADFRQYLQAAALEYSGGQEAAAG